MQRLNLYMIEDNPNRLKCLRSLIDRLRVRLGGQVDLREGFREKLGDAWKFGHEYDLDTELTMLQAERDVGRLGRSPEPLIQAAEDKSGIVLLDFDLGGIICTRSDPEDNGELGADFRRPSIEELAEAIREHLEAEYPEKADQELVRSIGREIEYPISRELAQVAYCAGTTVFIISTQRTVFPFFGGANRKLSWQHVHIPDTVNLRRGLLEERIGTAADQIADVVKKTKLDLLFFYLEPPDDQPQWFYREYHNHSGPKGRDRKWNSHVEAVVARLGWDDEFCGPVAMHEYAKELFGSKDGEALVRSKKPVPAWAIMSVTGTCGWELELIGVQRNDEVQLPTKPGVVLLMSAVEYYRTLLREGVEFWPVLQRREDNVWFLGVRQEGEVGFNIWESVWRRSRGESVGGEMLKALMRLIRNCWQEEYDVPENAPEALRAAMVGRYGPIVELDGRKEAKKEGLEGQAGRLVPWLVPWIDTSEHKVGVCWRQEGEGGI